MTDSHPQYPQPGDTSVGGMTILDLLFDRGGCAPSRTGPNAETAPQAPPSLQSRSWTGHA